MSVKQVIVVRKDLSMRKGKLAAQVSHASQGFLLAHGSFEQCESGTTLFQTKLRPLETEWLQGLLKTKIVVWVNSEKELQNLIDTAIKQGIQTCPIVDAGLTEFHGVPTLTCVAFGPDLSEVLDQVTGNLPLL